MPKQIKAVGFDLDGTLVNSLPGMSAAVDKTLRSAGFSAAGDALVATWIGNGVDILIERAFRWAGADLSAINVAKLRTAFDRYYAETIAQGSLLYPGVADTLEQLAQRQIKMALVTNKPTPFVGPLLEQLGVANYFDVVIGGDDVVNRKPHPAPLYLILGKLGLRAHELLFVGDSRNDIEAAQAAGCPSVGLTYGYNYGEPIGNSKPDYQLDNFDALLPLLKITDRNELIKTTQENEHV
jgi:phosphoglycolate phosphatase